MLSAARANEGFASPWYDMATLAMPENFKNALEWCEYIFQANGTYRMAMERIVAYFLTDLDIGSADPRDSLGDDEKEKWTGFLSNTLGILGTVADMGRDRLCFHGDTLAVTRDGVFCLRELAGKTVDVLSAGGVYRQAAFRSFGRQELLEVELSDGRTFLATPEHEWLAKNCSDRQVCVPTSKLRKGYRLPRVVAPRPEQNAEFYEGVRHGFTFGDGSCYNDGRQAAAYFYGRKDKAMLRYFRGYGCKPRRNKKGTRWVVHGLPAFYKQLPAQSASASYWYGFTCGFLAADGSVDIYGCAILTQKSRTVVEAVVRQLPRLGMAAGPVRGHFREANLTRQNGKRAVYRGLMHYATLLKQFMQPQDFLIPKHRRRFEANYRAGKYGEYVGVRAVRPTGLVDEVFCCVEPQTHTFVLGGGVLTRNCYGNAFASMMVPFRRLLSCPKCGNAWPFDVVTEAPAFNYRFDNYEFTGTCPTCRVGSGYHGKFNVNDLPDNLEKKLKIKIWNPHQMEIVHDLFTDDCAYVWRIPEDYKRKVRMGDPYTLARIPLPVLRAVQSNSLYRFAPDAIFHMKEPTLGGVINRGWGMPRTLTNFRDIWYVQVLRRYNEAIALDYVIPFRVLTPQPRPSSSGGLNDGASSDPLIGSDMGEFVPQVQAMLRKRRRNPANWNVLPFPIQYSALGGDAKSFCPAEMMDQGIDTLLNSTGAPADLYKGTLQLQVAPVALRLFEATFHHQVHGNNDFMRWVITQVSQLLSWEQISCKMRRVTHADDFQKQQAQLQLMMGQAISQTSGLKALGMDWKDEQRVIAEESRYQAQLQAEVQEEMEQASFGQQIAKGQAGAPGAGGGGGGGGGAPPPGGGGGGGGQSGQPGQPGDPSQSPVTTGMTQSADTPITPTDLMEQAESLAQQLQALPESQRRSELNALKQKNETLWSVVRAKMDQMKNKARTAGAAQMLGQQASQPQQ
jgi:hypothetical protein